jgi:hypothetical protein
VRERDWVGVQVLGPVEARALDLTFGAGEGRVDGADPAACAALVALAPVSASPISSV